MELFIIIAFLIIGSATLGLLAHLGIDPLDSIRNLFSQIRRFIWWFYDIVGLRWISEKLMPPINPETNTRPPSTFFVWAISVYLALFGIESQIYENKLDIVENRVNTVYVRLTTTQYKAGLRYIPVVLRSRCPYKPEITDPISIYYFFVKEGKCIGDIERDMSEILESYRNDLQGLNFGGVEFRELWLKDANLSGASFFEGNFEESNFHGTNLDDASFINAHFEGVNFSECSLQKAVMGDSWFNGAFFINADLSEATFSGSDFIGARFENANLKTADISSANTLKDSTYNSNTVFPKYFNPKEWGMIKTNEEPNW
ncbi:MAG: pentapeptide repeat-containing protein [Candidatus Thiodiazotropha taylori]|nr:pentapeptide repeat-containing protein [Candidatus Thiodiazotropha taylori]